MTLVRRRKRPDDPVQLLHLAATSNPLPEVDVRQPAHLVQALVDELPRFCVSYLNHAQGLHRRRAGRKPCPGYRPGFVTIR